MCFYLDFFFSPNRTTINQTNLIRKRELGKMGGCCKYPTFESLFALYCICAFTSIFCGAILIDGSSDAFEKDKTVKSEDATSMGKASLVIGIFSIVFSLVFIWNAVELGILLFCGQRDFCFLDKYVKNEMKSVLVQVK